jgi:fructosamine-3-kinase
MKILTKIFSNIFDTPIKSIQSIGGGSINQTYYVELINQQRFFIKLNSSDFKNNFEQEKFNLEYLQNKSGLIIPEVYHLYVDNDYACLILEYLEKTGEDKYFEYNLGKHLAELHKNTNSFFGWFQDNYIGSLPQKNTQLKNWIEFFVTQRLEPLVKNCYDKKLLFHSDIKSFENLYSKLENIFPVEPPSLLHGDLWTGNRMNTTRGVAVFDPACYFGFREMDIAMLNLFGHPADDFYAGYQSVYPLEKNFKERIPVCNLYPLLVHAVLFGYSYIYDIKSIIKKF